MCGMNNFQNITTEKTADLSSSKFIRAVIAVLLSFTLAIAPGLAFATEGGQVQPAQPQEAVEADAAPVESEEAPAAADDEETPEALEVDEDDSVGEASAVAVASDETSSDATETQSITAQSGEGGEFVTDPEPERSGDANMPITVGGNFSITSEGVRVQFNLSIWNKSTGMGETKGYTFKIDGVELKINGAYTPEVEGLNNFLPAADYGVNGKSNQWYTLKASGDYRVRVTARNSKTNAESYINAYFKVTSGTNVSSINAELDKVAAECKTKSTRYDKVLRAHDYIINTLKVTEVSNTRYVGATAVFFYKQANSKGFAQAMNLILSRTDVGVPNRVVSANGRYWNLVTIDGGQNMHVDVAEDSLRSADWNHLFFGVTDAQMKQLPKTSGYVPQSGMTATNYKLNYYIQKAGVPNNMATWSAGFKSVVANQVKNGKISFDASAVSYIGTASEKEPATYIIMCDNAAKYLTEASSSSPSSFGGKSVVINLAYDVTPQKSLYKVSTKTLNSPLLVISDLNASYNANGKAQTPVPTLTLNGTRLRYNTDFTVTYSNNVNPGTATMVIRGKGEYAGSLTKTFKINSTALYPIQVSGKWVKSGSRWWFSYDAATKKAQNNKTYPAGEWAMINGKRYYFDGGGWMKANWLQLGGKWYWLGSDGAMKTKWHKIKGVWYYMASDGIMQTTKQKIDGKWYNFKSSGAMVTGWLKEATGWFYYASSGAMKTGWLKTGGKWYFLSPKDNGRMKTGWLTESESPDGKRYWLTGTGAMFTGWGELAGNWYYFNGSGAMQKNKWIGNYYVKSDGVMAKDEWIGKYYVDGNGKWVPNKK